VPWVSPTVGYAPCRRTCRSESRVLSPTGPNRVVRSGLIAEAPSPSENRRLELPISFEVAVA